MRKARIRQGVTRQALVASATMLLLISSVGSAQTVSPREVVADTAGEVAERLDGRRPYYRKHPEELYALINEILLPNFDLRYAGYKVMGDSNWKAASGAQKKKFVETFYQFLLRSYATGLLSLVPESLVIKDEFQSNEKFASIQTTVREDTGTVIPVNYRLRLSKEGWRVYDVRIEGVSYVENYHNQFSAEIDALGLESVIARLVEEIEKMNQSAVDKESS